MLFFAFTCFNFIVLRPLHPFKILRFFIGINYLNSVQWWKSMTVVDILLLRAFCCGSPFCSLAPAVAALSSSSLCLLLTHMTQPSLSEMLDYGSTFDHAFFEKEKISSQKKIKKRLFLRSCCKRLTFVVVFRGGGVFERK